MAAAIVQSKTVRNTLPATFDSNVTAGNTILVFSNTGPNQVYLSGLSDNQGNTYTTDKFQENGVNGNHVAVSRTVATATGSLSVNATTGNSDWDFIVVEVSGLDVSPVAGTPVGATGTSTAAATGSMTAGGSGIVFGAMTHDGSGSPAITEAGGWTLLSENHSTAGFPHSVIYQTSANGNGYNAQWTIGSSSRWTALVINYAGAAGSGGGTSYNNRVGLVGLV